VPVLVILADTPTFAYRPREIRNGLSIPPQMNLRNVIQMMTHPTWSFSQLLAGAPEFKTMLPYLPKGLSMKHLGLFMNQTFSGRLNEDKIKAIRDKWKGKMVVKGIVTDEDAEKVLALGADGFICSNHGGRQLDAGQSTIKPMTELAKKYGGRTTVMMDSGLRSGPDVACALASGAKFTFRGRSFSRAADFAVVALHAAVFAERGFKSFASDRIFVVLRVLDHHLEKRRSAGEVTVERLHHRRLGRCDTDIVTVEHGARVRQCLSSGVVRVHRAHGDLEGRNPEARAITSELPLGVVDHRRVVTNHAARAARATASSRAAASSRATASSRAAASAVACRTTASVVASCLTAPKQGHHPERANT